MKPMSTADQILDKNYYDWTGNAARRKQRERNRKAKRTIRRIVKQKIKGH